MAVLDSSAIIDILKGNERGTRIKEKFSDELTSTTPFGVHECLFGTKGKEREITQKFLHNLDIIPFSKEICFRSVDVEEELYRRGTPINKMDVFIASICLAHDLPLLTTDKDFIKIEGLKVMMP